MCSGPQATVNMDLHYKQGPQIMKHIGVVGRLEKRRTEYSLFTIGVHGVTSGK